MQNSVRVDIGNNLASVEGINQRLEVHFLLKMVLVSQVGDNRVGGLLGVVEGDSSVDSCQ